MTISNISVENIEGFNKKAPRFKDRAFAILQFGSIPSSEIRNFLSKQGVELLEYIPENAFTVSITGKVNAGILQKAGVKSLVQLSAQQKMHPAISKGQISFGNKPDQNVDLRISYPKIFSASEILQFFKERNVEVISTDFVTYRIITIRIPSSRVNELASYPVIEYLEPVPPADKELNSNSTSGSRANTLKASAANGGRGLNGEGVVIGIGDGGDAQTHIDLIGARLINRAASGPNSHATHVHATAAGAGIVNELTTGYSSKATIVSQTLSNIILNTGTYVQDYGMVITNNSYGVAGSCGNFGFYDFTSRILDQHAFDYPHLQHVFAAGNSASITCPAYPAGFRTILSSYQSAKNILTVGATQWESSIWSGSSRGPVMDGRVKPDITAMGALVLSGTLNNGYVYGWGTSFASPAVVGGLGLLYQRYRQLHAGANPKNGLMKALLCNGGEDKGNSGPDFTFGYGWMNLSRSLNMLEAGRYFNTSISNSTSNQHNITIPANTAQLKVMLYWNDPAASLLSSASLVNDLDLTVVDPAMITRLPMVLDTSAGGLQNAATTGVDHINNMEQVIINNPSAGNYSINVNALVAQNPSQEYFIVYDIIPESVQLTYPVGGEGFVPGETEYIRWDSYDNGTNTFTVQYSTDNGISWIDINTVVSPGTRYLQWIVPNIPTSQAIIRIQKNGTAQSSSSQPFTLVELPVVNLSPNQCEGYISLQWSTVAGATDYEVMLARDGEMKSVGITTAASYNIGGLNKDSVYWFAVRPRINGMPGRRPIAQSHQPSSGSCAGSISDNDLKMDAVIAPVSGRKFTSSTLGTLPVTIRIKNLDDVAVTGATVRYQLNGSPWVSEAVAATINPGATYNHTFSVAENFSAIGNYIIKAVVDNNTPDPVKANDTLIKVIRQLDNQPISLASLFLDDLEATTNKEYTVTTIGLDGTDRYDFETGITEGRVRTFVNTGMAFSGSKALILDATKLLSPPFPSVAVIGTYNLAGYDVNTNDIRLDFKGRYNSLNIPATKKVWVRGNDTQPWISVYNYTNIGRSIPNLTPSIEIADSLKAQLQNFGTSFQVKWELPIVGMLSGNTGNGLIIDDIQLYEAFNDMQMLSIDTPVNLSCGLGSGVPLKVRVRNSSNNILTNVPVKYSINNGAWVQEIIPSIGANVTLEYTFTGTLNFGTSGVYNLRTLVDYPTDNYRLNDTLSTSVHNAPLVNAFPYLQNFEADNGGWYTLGTYSSWEYGIPASGKINKAASGSKAWKTKLAGNYNDLEMSYLYSPCFDIAGMSKPMLSLSLALDLEDCGTTLCDAAWVEYTTDNKTWIRLSDTASAGTNWYKKTLTDYVWKDQNYTRWHVATIGLPRSVPRIRLRFVMYADEAVNMEGIAIDDIHIYDSTSAIYTGVSPSNAITQSVSGTGWVHFEDGGQLIASILPNNQNLGVTEVQAYIHSGSPKYTDNHYYHNRNITIKPTNNSLADSATVRFYFTDSESEALIKATGCGICTKPVSAYELGVPKYSDPDKTVENGTITGNNNTYWSFINSIKVTKVPFQKGYYAEFKVKDFSEFWLSTGGLGAPTSLPVQLLDFSLQKESTRNVLVKWTSASEANILHYDIEVARGEEALRAGQFNKVGQVTARGNNSGTINYSFNDVTTDKTGTLYYRLRIVDQTGAFHYSTVRFVVFAQPDNWLVYPNPSNAVFNLVYQLNSGERLDASIYDAKGILIRQIRQTATGFRQKMIIDLNHVASGTYMLQTEVNGEKRFFKLYKQ